MSIEYFAAMEARIPTVEAERSLHLADAMTYPQMRSEDARRWWSRKVQTITRAAEQAGRSAGSLFMVDGKPVGVDGLRRWLRRTLGKGLTA